jgi:hypothetical protein
MSHCPYRVHYTIHMECLNPVDLRKGLLCNLYVAPVLHLVLLVYHHFCWWVAAPSSSRSRSHIARQCWMRTHAEKARHLPVCTIRQIIQISCFGNCVDLDLQLCHMHVDSMYISLHTTCATNI